MSGALRWMPLDIPDYLNDTGHLTTLQHGALLLLLMHYWRHGPLPDDDGQLASITKTDAKTWRAIKGVIRRFFHSGDNGELHQKRADMERDKAKEISAKRKAAAHGRWKPPPNGHANASANAPPQATPNGGAKAGPHATHNVPSTVQTEEVREESNYIYNNSLESVPPRPELSQNDADETPHVVDILKAREEFQRQLGDAGAEGALVRRVSAALATTTRPYGEVRSAEAQFDALKAQPAVVGADVTLGLRWQPAEMPMTPAEQYASLMGCSLAEAQAMVPAA